MGNVLLDIEERLMARADGRVEITQVEWEILRDAFQRELASGSELYRTKSELARVQRISRPLWRACRHVRAGMERAISQAASEQAHVALAKVRDWEIDLRLALRIDITDAPPGHRLHREFRR